MPRCVHILLVLLIATSVSAKQGPSQPPSSGAGQASNDTGTRKNPNDKSGQTSSTTKDQPVKPKPAPKPAKPQPQPPSYVYRIVPLEPSHDGNVLDASQIVGAMGNPAPFTLKAAGSNAIVVSSTKLHITAAEADLLDELIAQIKQLRAIQQTTGKVFEIYVPHADAKGELVTSIANIAKLNYKDLQVESIGTDKIRVTRSADAGPDTFKAFLQEINHLVWRVNHSSPVARVFYISTNDAVAAMGGDPQPNNKTNGNDGTDNGTSRPNNANPQDNGTPNAKTTSDTQKKGTSGADSTSQTTETKTPDKSTGKSKNSGKKGKNSSSNSKSTTGKDNGQDPPASGGSGQDTSSGNKQSDQANTDTTGTADNKPTNNQNNQNGGGNDSGKTSLSVKSVNNDVVVMSGDEGLMKNATRVLASVDFPRPEIIINAWSFQASSSNPKTIMKQSERLRREIGEFNDAIQRGIDRAWDYLQGEIGATPEVFFDEDFYNYLTQRYVADSRYDQESTQRLTEGPAFLRERRKYGICAAHQYCLGYTSLFRPLRPTLTDMLLAVIASQQPGTRIIQAIKRMDNLHLEPAQYQEVSNHNRQCDEADRRAIKSTSIGAMLLDELLSDKQVPAGKHPPDRVDRLPMFCFLEEIESEFSSSADAPSSHRVRVLRAAIANFLFHYKMAEQYPREFSPYDLSQSAQELNSELNPMIIAFNRDIAALLGVVSETESPAAKNGIFGFGGHGSNFINNGIITVRTLSGKETKVDTVTQSVFDATNPPSVTDIINSIGSAEKNVPGVLKTNLTANQAATIIGALSSVAPSESKIGREFDIDITPHSLSGASSAELDVTMTTQQSADPTLFSNGKSDTENLSRVARHNIQTKVRLESIKLFEISSFSAFLERSRRNFPLVPPFIELPYLGSFISLPLPGAKEYHRSTAVMSAIVVPTASDLANGLRFTADRVAVAAADPYGSNRLCASSPYGRKDELCAMRTAVSFADLGYSISAYHKAKVICFGTRLRSPFGPDGMRCDRLDLRELPQDAP